jgi:hypothetical protein
MKLTKKVLKNLIEKCQYFDHQSVDGRVLGDFFAKNGFGIFNFLKLVIPCFSTLIALVLPLNT